MPKPDRDFKGVWIPKEIWLSEQLSLMEKVIFVEIHSLDNERGCYASNRHFAEFFGVSERQIRTYIGSLKEKGFISVSIQNRNERVMRAIGKYARVRDADVRKLQQDRRELIHRWSVRGAEGVGRKLPGR
jgi:hypothetical protein